MAYLQQLLFGLTHLLHQDLALSTTASTKGPHHLLQGVMGGLGLAPKPGFVEMGTDVCNNG